MSEAPKRRYKNRKRRKKKAVPAKSFVILEHASILKRIGAYMIDVAIFGAIIEIQPGLYTGEGNYDLDPNGMVITIIY